MYKINNREHRTLHQGILIKITILSGADAWFRIFLFKGQNMRLQLNRKENPPIMSRITEVSRSK